jgi:hypothetical protein
VVIGDLDIGGVSIVPSKAEAVLVVDSDAVLPLAVSFQRLQLVAGNCRQVAQRDSPVQMEELPQRDRFDGLKLLGKLLPEDLLRLRASNVRITFIVYRYAISSNEMYRGSGNARKSPPPHPPHSIVVLT